MKYFLGISHCLVLVIVSVDLGPLEQRPRLKGTQVPSKDCALAPVHCQE